MNKTQLVNAIAEKTGQSKAEAAAFLTATTDVIQDAVASGQEVVLIGFGTFKPVDKPAKSGFSALLGRVVDTPASTVPKFTAGSTFKAAVNGGQKVKQVA